MLDILLIQQFALSCSQALRRQDSIAVSRVDMGEGGVDALVTLGQGDMRRTLNILQVAP